MYHIMLTNTQAKINPFVLNLYPSPTLKTYISSKPGHSHVSSLGKYNHESTTTIFHFSIKYR